MKHRLLSAGISIMAVLTLGAPAAAQTQLWIRQFGTVTNDYLLGAAPDGAEGVYVCGATNGSLGGPFAGNTTGAIYGDAWFARYDGSGTRLWIRQPGASGGDHAAAVCADAAGGVFVVGYTCGDVPVVWCDMWIARYDALGTQLWIRQWGTPYGEPKAASADGAGGAFVCGQNGSSGHFVARYDSDGNELWYVQVPSANVSGWAVAPDGAGGAFVAWQTGNPTDIWLARYDSAGSQVWSLVFGTTTNDYCWALAPDGAGGVFIAGYTFGSLGGPIIGLVDAWLARYDGAGNQTWIRQFGSTVGDEASALAPDGAGGVFVAGPTDGYLFGPIVGGKDMFIAHYDGAGNQLGGRHLGSAAGESATAAAPAGSGGVYVAGWTLGALGGPSAGGRDAWLARYGDACYPDCNSDGQLTVADFGCFQTKFVAGDPYADCNGDGSLTVADFGCFQTKFVAGCP